MTANRIVSLIPAATEIVAALGCADRLVGVSHECDYPPGVVGGHPVCTESSLDMARPSGAIHAEVEDALKRAVSIYRVKEDVLRRLEPDLILTQDQCEACGVSLRDVEAATRDWLDEQARIVSLRPSSLDSALDDILRVAEALDAREAGEALVADMRRRLDAIAQRTASLCRRHSVACIEWTDPPMAAGHWVPELVALAGGTDPFGTTGERAAVLSWPALAMADPDAIVFMPCGFGLERTRCEAEALAARHPEWDSLKAVRNGRVYVTDGNAFFNRPGPRLVESAEILAEILHPGFFTQRHRNIGWAFFPVAEMVM